MAQAHRAATQGLQVTTAPRLEALVQGLVAEVEAAGIGPFEAPTVVHPGPAHQRHLSQAMATANGFGVCAGVDFCSFSALRRRMGEQLGWPEEDAWSAHVLPRVVLLAFDEGLDEPWAHHLSRHLSTDDARPGRRLATASRVAALFQRYSRDLPGMVQRWDASDDVGHDGQPLPDSQRWQAHLWRRVRRLTEAPAPFERQQQLVEALTAGRITAPTPLHVLVADALHPRDTDVLAAIATRSAVSVWQLTSAEADAPLGRLGRVHQTALERWRELGAEPRALACGEGGPTLLAAVQDAVAGHSRERVGAGGITIIGSHGPTRQVEVLRDHLCALFEDDPTLEPRDVAVLCPDVERYHPLLDAAMVVQPVSDDAHPGHQLRVSVSHRGGRSPNEVLALLSTVLALRSRRATWQELVDLCLSRPIATRFGFGSDNGERLRMLVQKAGIQWGLDHQHRSEEGVAHAGGTWLAGAESLALGAALANAPVTSVARRTPAVALDSQYAEMAGQLSEFISRIRKFHHEAKPTTASSWNERLQDLLSDLVDMPRSERWQLASARALLSEWAGSGHDQAVLGRADMRRVVDEIAASARTRPAFGTGALIVSGLEDLAAIPHRVVVVLGLDNSVFPGSPRELGDDLLAGVELPGLPSARDLRQQHLLDALLAAREQFTVIHQSHSASTRLPIDEPVAVGELRRAVREVSGQVPTIEHWEALAWSPGNFQRTDDDVPRSFDQRARRAFASIGNTPVRRTDHGLEDIDPLPLDPVVDVEEVLTFLRHPARAFLTRRAGVSFHAWGSDQSESIPLETGFLLPWKAKNEAMERAMLGESPDLVLDHVRSLSGTPPTRAAHAQIERAVQQGAQFGAALRARGARRAHLSIDLQLPGETPIRLVGSVPTVDGRHEIVTVSKSAKAVQVMQGWFQALALAVATGQEPLLVVSTPARTYAYQSAGTRTPLAALHHLVLLQQVGRNQPILAPLKTLAGLHAGDDRVQDTWESERDEDWKRFTPRRVEQLCECETVSPTPTGQRTLTVQQLADELFGQLQEVEA